LRTTPSVNVSNNGGIGKTSALRIRGEESYRTLVLIDGMSISDSTAPQVSPRFEDLMSSGIERIEVLRGPQGMMYGADAGGIVNITTRRAHEPFAADAAIEYGRFDTRNLFTNIRGKGDTADYSLSASHFDTDGFNARTTDTVARDDDGYLNTTLHLNGGLSVTDDLRIDTTVRNVRAENEYDGFSSTKSYVNDYDFTAFRVSTIYNIASMQHLFALQRSDSTREDFADGISSGENNGIIDEAQYKGIFRFDRAGDIVYGADLKEESYKPEDDRRQERDQVGYYAEWQGHVAHAFFYTAGLRYDDNDDFGEHVSYRTSVAYPIDFDGDTLKLKSSYGTGFRAPSLYEINYNRTEHFGTPASNVELEEETSKGFDIGFEYHWHNASYLEIVYFDQAIHDAISYDLVNSTGYLQDSGTAHSRGVELSGIYHLNDQLHLLGNYTYNDTEDPEGNQRVRRPRHIANLGFDLQPGIESVTIHANLRIVRDAEDTVYNPVTFDAERKKLDNYSTLQASINWSINKQLDVYIRGENLLRDDYEEITTYNTPKASVYGGMRYHFR
jgi:vitamin B12 transporter